LKVKDAVAAKAKERQGKRNDLKENNIPQTFAECKETRKELADAAQVSHTTLDKAEYIVQHADEESKQKLRAGNTTINAEFKRLRKQAGREERQRQKQADVLIPLDDRIRFVCSSIADAVKHVDKDSIDFIITDPPYPKEYLDVYTGLARFAEHALHQGGSLLCMVGQSYLPEILHHLQSEQLRYHWTLAYLTPGGQATQLWERKVNTFWKPVLWFTKGNYGCHWVGDVVHSKTNDNDKEHHHWGQSESGMLDMLDRLVLPNQTVCDPFAGGGTTGIAALKLKCRFIGLDSDSECIAKSQQRLSTLLQEQ
jgi:site-specific DNA-methyltransferase (adenine-specific)